MRAQTGSGRGRAAGREREKQCGSGSQEPGTTTWVKGRRLTNWANQASRERENLKWAPHPARSPIRAHLKVHEVMTGNPDLELEAEPTYAPRYPRPLLFFVSLVHAILHDGYWLLQKIMGRKNCSPLPLIFSIPLIPFCSNSHQTFCGLILQRKRTFTLPCVSHWISFVLLMVTEQDRQIPCEKMN